MAIPRQYEVKLLTKICKWIEFSKMEDNLVQEQNQDNRLNERRMCCDHS
jgi:hypothetical protein